MPLRRKKGSFMFQEPSVFPFPSAHTQLGFAFSSSNPRQKIAGGAQSLVAQPEVMGTLRARMAGEHQLPLLQTRPSSRSDLLRFADISVRFCQKKTQPKNERGGLKLTNFCAL